MRQCRWVGRAGRALLLGTTATLWSSCGGGAELTAPTTGTIEVTTSTSGDEPDPDGYTLTLDDVEVQAIGVAASATLPDLPPGTYRIGLTGISANCTVSGGNPRTVTVAAGETAAEAMTVVCTTPPPDVGSLEVTTTSTGAPPDASGYTVSVDGGAELAIGVNASRLIEGLTPGPHSVALAGLAGNCVVQGENPRSVTITAGETAALAFAVECSATTGGLAVTITGLPGGVAAAVTVSGPGGYSEPLTASRTLTGLEPGAYTVSAASVSGGGVTYSSDPEDRSATVEAGETAELTVTYTAGAGSSLNLRIAGLNLTQSVQTFGNEVPLVAGRDAFLRVTALASESNTVTPAVRVRLYDAGVLVETFTISAPADTVPTGRTDGDLGTTWNLLVPGTRIRPGLAVQADVDPAGEIAEADETDNVFPAGSPRTLEIRPTPPLAITLVPVRQSANQLQGDVTAGNRDSYLDFTRRIHPIPGYDAVVHQVYTTTTNAPLQSDDANGAWNTILSEINLLRLAEDDGRDYYGVVQVSYDAGLAGLGFIGIPAAIGYDHPTDRGRVTAHELGHTWDRDHAPCGNPPQLDPGFPNPDGSIGRIGYDVEAGVVKPRSTPDVMGYCGDPWISDYTYQGVMDFRGTALGRAPARAEPVLLVWGRLVGGRAVLEPALQVVARPVLPERQGAWSIEGTASDGSRVFGLSFDPVEVADDRRGARHFAFAVPLDGGTAGRLEHIRLAGPGVGAAARSRPPASLRMSPAGPAELVRAAGGLALRWDAAAHPMVMVRDPSTGEVLSLARGGKVQLPAAADEVDLVMSDGVRSSTATLRVR
jgi:hypothetical protein